MASALRKLIEKQAQEADVLTRGEVRRALSLYREARGDLLQRLEWLDETTFSAQHYRNALVQVDHGLADMQARLRGDLKAGSVAAGKLSGHHLDEQRRAFGQRFRGTVRETPLNVARAINEGQTLLLPQFEASVRRYGADVIGLIQRRLAVGAASHEFGRDTKRALFRDILQPLGGVQMGREVVPTTAYWAERIVRTETVAAYNTTFQAHLNHVGERQPDLQKKWSSVLDRRTSSVCRDLEGRAVPYTHPFRLPGGRTVMAPPALPNCRSMILAWLPEWAPAAAELFG